MKRCSNCGVEKPIEAFYTSRANKDGHTYECRGCVKFRREHRSPAKKAEEARRLKVKRDSRSPEQVAADREKSKKYYLEKMSRLPGHFQSRQALWVQNNPTAYIIIQRRSWLKKYNLTEELYQARLAEQDEKCAICKEVFNFSVRNSVHIDHCHETGSVRGILCNGCNVGIGQLKDSPTLLRLAAEYIEKQTNLINERLYLGNLI